MSLGGGGLRGLGAAMIGTLNFFSGRNFGSG